MNQFIEDYKQMIGNRLFDKRTGREVEPNFTYTGDPSLITYSLRLAIATMKFNQELGKTIFLLDDEEVLDEQT